MEEPVRVTQTEWPTPEEARRAARACTVSERAWVPRLTAKELAVFVVLKNELGAVETDEAGWPLK